MVNRFSRIDFGEVNIVVVSVPHTPTRFGLSTSERAVAELLASGNTNVEIAALRGTSVRTVANQVHAIVAKLGVRGRRDVARALIDGGP